MSVKKPKKDMLNDKSPSGSLLFDKDFGDDVKEKYKNYELTEEDMMEMSSKKETKKLLKEFKNLREGR